VQVIEHQLHVGIEIPVGAEGPDVLHAATNAVDSSREASRAVVEIEIGV
jgi:hypothetical protein